MYEHTRTIADVRGDALFRLGRKPKLRKSCVDRLNQVPARVDQSAVKVEDQQAELRGRDGTENTDHLFILQVALPPAGQRLPHANVAGASACPYLGAAAARVTGQVLLALADLLEVAALVGERAGTSFQLHWAAVILHADVTGA